MNWLDVVPHFIRDYDIVFIMSALTLALILAVAVIRLQLALKKMGAKRTHVPTESGVTLETIEEIIKRIEKLEWKTGAAESAMEDLDNKIGLGLCRFAIVRFDAFSDVGGKQSFALAVLDRNMNGVIITSLYGRSESRVYAKEIIDGQSSHSLSDEEKEALAKAGALER